MATKRAIEGSALSFSAGASWVGGAGPASTNDLIIGEGFFTYTSGFALGAVNAASLKVHSSARCEIGGAGSIGPLVMDINNSGAGLLWGPSSGHLYLSGSTNLVSQESSAAPMYLNGGTHAALVCSTGTVSVGADANLTDVYALGGTVEIAASSGSDRVALLYVVDATVRTSRDVDTYFVAGRGRVIFEDGAKCNNGGAGRGYVMDARAKVIINGNADLTFDRITALAGTVDPSAMEGTLTITAADVTPRANIIRDTLQGRITITTETKLGTPGRFTGAVSPLDP